MYATIWEPTRYPTSLYPMLESVSSDYKNLKISCTRNGAANVNPVKIILRKNANKNSPINQN